MLSFFKRKKENKTDSIPEPSHTIEPVKKEGQVTSEPSSETALSSINDKPVKIYSLSTCSHCKATKKFLSDCTIKYDFIDVDLLQGEERKAILEDVKKYNPKCSFPTIIIGDKVVVGFIEEEIKEALGL